MQAAGINPERCTFSQIPIAMWLLAAFPIFFYHMMKVIKAAGRTTWLRAFGASLAALVHPTRRVPQRAGAARAYFYVTFSPVWIGLSVFLHHKGLISWPVSLTLSCWAFLFSIASFVLVYISYYPEQSSIRIKIIGITLTTVLGITCGISWLIGMSTALASTDPTGSKQVRPSASRPLETRRMRQNAFPTIPNLSQESG